jgi:hypothetical protein
MRWHQTDHCADGLRSGWLREARDHRRYAGLAVPGTGQQCNPPDLCREAAFLGLLCGATEGR